MKGRRFVLLPIETERLLVRAFALAVDSAAMAAVYCDPVVMRYVTGGALADVDAVRSVLDAHVGSQRQRGFGFWAIVKRETREVIGDVGFGTFGPAEDLELGYTLARASWGRGYATEAAAACLRTGMEQLAPERIVCVVDEENVASLRVAEKIGMTRVETIEAQGRPHALFEARAAGCS